MGQKDLSQKYLLEKNDVFADVINVLLGGGKELLKPEQLENMETESIYYNEGSKKVKNMFRDVCKKNTENGQVYAIFGIENQQKIDYSMPLRCMGYDYISYQTQKEKLLEQRKQNEEIKNPQFRKEDRLAPVITLVLNYSKTWDGPLHLHDMLMVPEEFENAGVFIPDYKMNLVSLENLEFKKLEQFTSDFQILAAYIRYEKDPERLEQFFTEHRKPIRHPLEIQKAITAVSGDERYLEWELDEEGEHTMCELYDMMLNRGLEEGLEKGLKKGLKKGLEKGRRQGILKMISVLHSLNQNEADIKMILKSNYELTDEEIEQYLREDHNLVNE